MRDTIACPGCGIWIERNTGLRREGQPPRSSPIRSGSITANGTSFECRDCDLLRKRINEMASMVERLTTENEALRKEATKAAIMRSMIGGLLKEGE